MLRRCGGRGPAGADAHASPGAGAAAELERPASSEPAAVGPADCCAAAGDHDLVDGGPSCWH